jgi:hypothetical protein
MFQEHEARNFQSDLDFGRFHRDSFTVGIEGSREGAIVDLGPPDELAKRYGYKETLGYGQGYASIRMKNGKVVILEDFEKKSVQPLKEASVLYSDAGTGKRAAVRAGHLYLVRVFGGRRSERVVKLLVLEFRPGESVTFRWERIG